MTRGFFTPIEPLPVAGHGPGRFRAGRHTTGALTLVFYLSTLIYGCFEFVRTVSQNAFGARRISGDAFFRPCREMGGVGHIQFGNRNTHRYRHFLLYLRMKLFQELVSKYDLGILLLPFHPEASRKKVPLLPL